MKTMGMAALSALMLAGCATGAYGPRYEQATSQYDEGYSQNKIDDNRYRVSYRVSNGDAQLAQDWALRRAAELTLDQRYDWFQIISRNRAFQDNDFDRYEKFRSYNDRYNDRPRYDNRYDDGDAVAMIEVIMGGNPPPRSASVYDARQVLNYTRASTRY